MKDILIKRSDIGGKGAFANRDFSKGEIVLRWHPKLIGKKELEDLPRGDRHFVEKIGKRTYLMQPPERYVNHSCDPNTISKNRSDIAKRDIVKGEEITTDYSGLGIESFPCRCGSKKCRKVVH